MAKTEPRAGLLRLHDAIHTFSVAERRLMWRDKDKTESYSYSRFWVLGLIMAEGAVTHSQIVEQTNLNPASVTKLVERLQDHGLIERRRDERDGRKWWISLTAHGVEQVTAVHEGWTQSLAQRFAETSDADLDAACKIIEEVASLFDAIRE
jgi:DNA-binding MarR family transcriptional regulator